MNHYLRILRAFFGFEAVPKCYVCRRYCVKGWDNVSGHTSQDPRYICLACYAKEITA